MSDSTADRVKAILIEAAYASYAPAEPVTCASCGEPTNTRDGYDVETPFTEIWICPTCNVKPENWFSQASPSGWPVETFIGPVGS